MYSFFFSSQPDILQGEANFETQSNHLWHLFFLSVFIGRDSKNRLCAVP